MVDSNQNMNDFEEDNNNMEEDDDIENNKDSNNLSVKTDPKEKQQSSSNPPKQPGTKQKRRSKNDCIGRDYVCGCGKTYLSYPALYTHIKTKHNGKTPEGTNANQVQSGRGRGRPRKNLLLSEELMARRTRESNRKENVLDEKNNELRDLLNKNNYNEETYKENEFRYWNIYKAFGLLKKWKEEEVEKMKKSDDNSNEEDVEEIKEGSDRDSEEDIEGIDVDRHIDEEIDLSNDSSDKTEEKQHTTNVTSVQKTIPFADHHIDINAAQNLPTNPSSMIEAKSEDYDPLTVFPPINANISYLPLYELLSQYITNPSMIPSSEDKHITCDQAMTLFLLSMSKSVTVDFFKLIVVIIKQYRDCMNKLGWQILSQYKKLNDEDRSSEYCSVKDASRLPEIANDFLSTYLPIKLPSFDKYFAVILISHFNFWLYGNDYTFISLSIGNNPVNNNM